MVTHGFGVTVVDTLSGPSSSLTGKLNQLRGFTGACPRVGELRGFTGACPRVGDAQEPGSASGGGARLPRGVPAVEVEDVAAAEDEDRRVAADADATMDDELTVGDLVQAVA